MKVIIAGSRSITDYAEVERAMKECGFTPTIIISGTARGADRLGEQWAQQHSVRCVRMPADWDKHGHSAGVMRNVAMAKEADALVLVWDGRSRGSAHMLRTMQGLSKPVHVHRVTP